MHIDEYKRKVKSGELVISGGEIKSGNISSEFKEELSKESIFILNKLVPGMNGSDGLLREHWTNRKKRKLKYMNIFRSQVKCIYKGTVSIDYVRYCCRFMDWDNMGASFKCVGDALVGLGILGDDGPEVIRYFRLEQKKVHRRCEEMVEIIIRPLGK